MNNTDLYTLAMNNNVEISNFSMPKTKSASAMAMNGNTYIAVDYKALENLVDERVHLAHELGHCITGSFYNIYSAIDVRGKHEHHANVWAIKKLIPKDELENAFADGIVEVWELAAHFNVTEDFVRSALKYYGQI